jgi:hypothetical protein
MFIMKTLVNGFGGRRRPEAKAEGDGRRWRRRRRDVVAGVSPVDKLKLAPRVRGVVVVVVGGTKCRRLRRG